MAGQSALAKRDTVLPAGVSLPADPSTDDIDEMLNVLAHMNCNSFLQLDGAAVVLDACSSLLFLSRYRERWRGAASGKNFLLPSTLSDALTTRNSSVDFGVLCLLVFCWSLFGYQIVWIYVYVLLF